MTPSFSFAITDWALRFFGPNLDSKGLCALANDLGTTVDLSPNYVALREIKAAGGRINCVLPEMGKKDDGTTDYDPFDPAFNNPAHARRVHDALFKALEVAVEVDAPNIIVFAGTDTGEPEDVQYGRIVDGFTKANFGAQVSLIDRARTLRKKFLIESLNTLGDPAKWKGHLKYLATSARTLVEKVLKKVRSSRLSLAYDAYHEAMMGHDPIAFVQEFGPYIGVGHAAGVMSQGGLFLPTNRGEITLPGQTIPYAEFGLQLHNNCGKEMHIVLEHIPTVDTLEGTRNAIIDSMTLLRSKLAA